MPLVTNNLMLIHSASIFCLTVLFNFVVFTLKAQESEKSYYSGFLKRSPNSYKDVANI